MSIPLWLFAAVSLALIALLAVGIWIERRAAARTAAQLQAALASAGAKSRGLQHQVETLEAEVARLARFRHVADTDAAVAEMMAEARQAVEFAAVAAERYRVDGQGEHDRLVAAGQAQASRLTEDGRREAGALVREASARLQAATAAADATVAAAERRAEEIAGEALAAVRNIEMHKRTITALQNTIRGYGDEYIIPTHSLLDDLAEEVGHAEAGQRLKMVRDQVKQMIRTEKAATCDYAEPHRRGTAIRFVVDAFNGKVDSILSRVRHDNAGKLQQEVRDAFALVNHNGAAFRNARILEGYLTIRLEEVRWASVAHELKMQEREEQRQIKEQIREEEKARREYERVIREAAKEEDTVRRAMEKAQQMLAAASEAQKAKYEAQLAELAMRLQAAEERNQRALSMAQQTRRGHVYVISNLGSFGEHVYKIGLTRRLDPLERIRELGDSSVPFEFDVHALIFSEDAPALESQLHRHFLMSQMNKVNHRKEFFRVDLAHIRAEIETLGLTAAWTMTATAREYKETQAIERAIQASPAAREAWINRQLSLEVAFEAEEDEAEQLAAQSPAVVAA